MIEKKMEGHEIQAVPATPRRTGQVVDIFAALKKSLGNRRAAAAESHRRSTQAQKEGVGPDGIQCNQHYQKKTGRRLVHRAPDRPQVKPFSRDVFFCSHRNFWSSSSSAPLKEWNVPATPTNSFICPKVLNQTRNGTVCAPGGDDHEQ